MIIDFHAHIFPDKIAEATVSALSKGAGIPPHSNGALSGLLEQMNKAEVDVSINLPVLTKSKQFDSIFSFAKTVNQMENGVISFCGIHPDDEEYEKHLHLIKEAGIKGIKIHPDYQGAFFDDERYVKILSLAKSLDLITVTHAGLDGAFIGQEIKCTPVRVLRLLDAIGGYDKLVLAHLGGNELYDEVFVNLAGESVYFDTSYVLPFLTQDQFEKMVERHGENKILFATDSPWQDQRKMVDILKGYGLGAHIQNKILCENAKKLLNI
ncbi:MAG: amidohydrolase family protein [Clostridia bacterium]|nr:amidohydrolase family protein [Clostridia bacterium]